ncbi:MAG: hypothetical protein IJC73_02160 [Lentisphaeria bacterium]|nr:hypothetical protein [Lentisphaeria bacterium]
MKKSLLFIALCVVAAALTGCMSTHTNDATAVATFSVESKEYQPIVTTGEKVVTGEATLHSVFGLINWGVSDFADDAFVSVTVSTTLPIQLCVSPNDAAKQGAVYNACAASKADAIVAAKYKLDIMDYIVYKCIKAKVTGYPAKVVGIK